jgi:gliding motility-associated-like protein
MDANGCVLELVARVPLDTDLYVPNIFTPNDDGFNDTFFIRNLPITGGAQIVISNRWGKEVYSSKDYQNNWDGGNTADGVYYYRLTIPDGTTVNGWVEILRGKKP